MTPRFRFKGQFILISLLFLAALRTDVMAQYRKPAFLPGADQGISSGKKSEVQATALLKSIEHASSDKWAVSVRTRTSRNHQLSKLGEIKKQKEAHKQSSYVPGMHSESAGRAVEPKIERDFEANWSLESVPPDNSIAISNGGIIVTANNDGIEYYNHNGGFLYFDFWSDFFEDGSLTSSIFDPKVIYDSGADRFILAVLHGSSPATSKVLVCFSKTNNPNQGWHVYSLTGNPVGNGAWFDYPGLGISNNEVYVTGNLFRNNSFDQSVIYQINKANGYAGQNLQWQYWYDLSATPFEAFTLAPASWGQQGTYGPGLYFVSNESTGDNDIRLWDLTDDLSGTPQILSYTIATEPYSPSPDAFQLGSEDKLDNGDCRILDAFYLDGIIHFVFQTDIGDGWNGISYNRLQVNNQTIVSSTFGLQGEFDYSYPALASFATQSTDRSVMIAFLRSSEEIYPQCRVVNVDQNMVWSPSTLVKSGETFIDFLSGDERWGDYTGMARRHNSAQPRVWMAASYGADVASQNTFNTYKTRVAEISAGATVSTDEATSIEMPRVYPNPVIDWCKVEFDVTAPELIQIDLVDMEGSVVKMLYRDIPRTGKHQLAFNKNKLLPGMYFLRIYSQHKTLYHEKLVVLD